MATQTEAPPHRSPMATVHTLLDTTMIAGRPLGWYLSGWRLGLLILVLVIVYPISGLATGELILDGCAIGIYVVLAVGLNMVVGYAGLLDLGYVAFFAIGTYTLAAGTFGAIQLADGRLVLTPTFSFWPLIIVGAIVAGIFGVLLGAPTLRLRGDYLAIVTLGFGEIVPDVFKRISFFQGNTGISAKGPSPINTPFGLISFTDPVDRTPYYYLVLAFVVIVVLASIALRDSSLGRAWVAIREDETAAATSGVNLVQTKLLAFGLGATIGGIGGVLNAGLLQNAEPDLFSFNVSITVLVMIVLGGLGSISGVILGAVILRFIDVYLLGQINTVVGGSALVTPASSPLHFLANFDFGTSKFLIYGLLLVAMVLIRPQGLIPDRRRKRELAGIGASPESASAVGLLEREEAGVAIGGAGSEDATAYAGPGTDDQGGR